MNAPLRRPLFACALLAAIGCGADFDPYNRLTSLRVLAIQNEPPSPGPGETTTLTPLVFTTEPGIPTSYAWSWCPFPGDANAGYPCQVTQEQATMLAGQSGVTLPPFDLGDGITARLPHGIDPAVLRGLCAGVPGSPILPDCEGGFPVQVKVRVRAGGDEVVAVTRVRLRIDSTPNANPRIDGLAAVIDGMERAIAGDNPEVTLPRIGETVIKASLPESLSELYQGKNDEGQPALVRERLFLSWFVEGGNTDHEITSFIAGKVPLELLLKNTWTPPKLKDYPRDTARLYVVIRDNRGGVAWRSGSVKLGGAP